jgi:hypothetical protein
MSACAALVMRPSSELPRGLPEMRCHFGCGMASQKQSVTQSATRSSSVGHMMQ